MWYLWSFGCNKTRDKLKQNGSRLVTCCTLFTLPIPWFPIPTCEAGAKQQGVSDCRVDTPNLVTCTVFGWLLCCRASRNIVGLNLDHFCFWLQEQA